MQKNQLLSGLVLLAAMTIALAGCNRKESGADALAKVNGEKISRVVTDRNKVMADHAAPILARGNAFMAVGAMHLPGPEGLVEGFRKAGYTVTAVD